MPGPSCAPSITANRKFVLVVKLPSLTTSVISASPIWPASGVSVTTRLLPLPPNTMSLADNRAESLELPESVRSAAAVSASPTVKGMDKNAVPVLRVWSSMAEMAGGVFGGLGGE